MRKQARLWLSTRPAATSDRRTPIALANRLHNEIDFLRNSAWTLFAFIPAKTSSSRCASSFTNGSADDEISSHEQVGHSCLSNKPREHRSSTDTPVHSTDRCDPDNFCLVRL